MQSWSSRANTAVPVLDRGTVLLHVQRGQTSSSIFLGVTLGHFGAQAHRAGLAQIAAIAFESQDGMIVTDAHKTILRVNHAFSQISGYAPHEVIGRRRVLRPIGTCPISDAIGATIQPQACGTASSGPTQER